jgi:hypothetical protein
MNVTKNNSSPILHYLDSFFKFFVFLAKVKKQ